MKKHLFIILFAALASMMFVSCKSNRTDLSSKEQSITIDNIGNCRIGVLIGSTHDQYISKNFPDSKIFRFNSIPDLTTAITSKQCDVILMSEEILPELRSSDTNFSSIGTAFSESFGVGFNKSNQELRDAFNTVLKDMKESGLYDSLRIKVVNKQFDDPLFSHPEVQGEPVKVGLIVQNSEFCFIQEKNFYGIEPELCRYLGDAIHRPIEFCLMDFGALIPSLVSNKIDMIVSTLCITEERQKQILFSEPYASSNVSVVIYTEDGTHKSSVNIVEKTKESFYSNFVKEARWKMIVEGLWKTIIITIFAILIGTLIGCIICWMNMSNSKLLQVISRIFIEVLRDVPILVFLMLMFYVVFAHSNVTATCVAIIAFAMNFGAFTSVMFKTGIEGVDRGQHEAGMALGFSKTGTFFNFIAPQALNSIVPLFKNEAVSLLKNTSIVGYIAIQDLTKVSDIIRSRTFDAFFPLIIVSIVYFILAWLIGKSLDMLVHKKEVKKVKRNERKS